MAYTLGDLQKNEILNEYNMQKSIAPDWHYIIKKNGQLSNWTVVNGEVTPWTTGMITPPSTNNSVSGQLGAISTDPVTTPPVTMPPIHNPGDISSQVGALNSTGNVNSTVVPQGATPTTDNGVGNSTSGTQMLPSQTSASLGNISQTTPQDAQRQILKTDPNNITGYQDLSTIKN